MGREYLVKKMEFARNFRRFFGQISVNNYFLKKRLSPTIRSSNMPAFPN